MKKMKRSEIPYGIMESLSSSNNELKNKYVNYGVQ